jgi:peptide-methionine (R)-S-oxide reductase
MDEKKKSDAEWKELLSPEEYRIMREKGTERAFTGRYWNTKDPGIYRCRGCGTELFSSESKYDSGCGWPSFTAPAEEAHLRTDEDRSHFMRRTEVLCSSCDAHLGHVFPDGPGPTGLRYCINSACMTLDPESVSEG